jgi:hypothetical protein
MAGHRPFKELTKGFSEARKECVVAGVFELKHEIALHELRQARERSQQDLNFDESADTPDGRRNS